MFKSQAASFTNSLKWFARKGYQAKEIKENILQELARITCFMELGLKVSLNSSQLCNELLSFGPFYFKLVSLHNFMAGLLQVVEIIS